jgi:hypothetical protein
MYFFLLVGRSNWYGTHLSFLRVFLWVLAHSAQSHSVGVATFCSAQSLTSASRRFHNNRTVCLGLGSADRHLPHDHLEIFVFYPHARP